MRLTRGGTMKRRSSKKRQKMRLSNEIKSQTQKDIKIIVFPDDDQTWRIDWFDKFSRNSDVESDPTIKVMLSPITQEKNSILDGYTTNWLQSRVITLPVSYLNLISIGSTWRKRKFVSSLNDNDKAYSFKISIPSQNIEPVFKTIAKEAKGISWNYKQFFETKCLVLENCKFSSIYNQNIVGRVIIPCPELVRFYYGTSTILVRKITYHSDDSFWNQLVLIKDSEGKKRTELSGSKLLLTLKTKIPNSDCWAIARLWTDPTAQQEVNRLCRGISGPNVMFKVKENMEMGFPFSCSSKLQVYGKMSADGQSLLVLNIEVCDADFLFKELKLDRENSNKVKNKLTFVREVGFSYNRISSLDNSGDVTLSNHSEPTKNVARQTLKNIIDNPRFSKIREIKFESVVKENRKYRSAPGKTIPSPPELTYGTGDGSYAANENHLPVNIVEDFQEKENIEVTSGNNPRQNRNKNDARPYFCELVEAMRELQKLHDTYEFDWNVISLPTGTKHREIKMSTFPEPNSSEGPGSIWLNISNSKRRKIMWIEVRRGKKFTYIVELDCRPNKGFATYFLTYQGGRKVSVAEINQVMRLWASNQKYCKPNGLEEHGKLFWEKKILAHNGPEGLAKKIWDKL